MKITWSTLPYCAGKILAPNGRSVLIQTDYDYPGVASTFGWSMRSIQRCVACGELHTVTGCDTKRWACLDCNDLVHPICDHRGTDGTVVCPDCGIGPDVFIASAGEYLSDNDGAEADDPGYFSE